MGNDECDLRMDEFYQPGIVNKFALIIPSKLDKLRVNLFVWLILSVFWLSFLNKPRLEKNLGGSY